jgi:hypothetical protein
LDDVTDANATDDLLFLESWEANSVFSVAAVLRASQIRRANPCLAAQIRTELRRRQRAHSAGLGGRGLDSAYIALPSLD